MNKFDTFATYADLVYDVTDTTAGHNIYITNWTRNRLKNCHVNVFCIPFLLTVSVMLPRFGSPLT